VQEKYGVTNDVARDSGSTNCFFVREIEPLVTRKPIRMSAGIHTHHVVAAPFSALSRMSVGTRYLRSIFLFCYGMEIDKHLHRWLTRAAWFTREGGRSWIITECIYP